MGLDTYACYWNSDEGKPGDLAPPGEFEDINVVRGLMFGTPQSFRGKVYAKWVYMVTDVSLYEEVIPPETVASMAAALEADVNDEEGLWQYYLKSPPPPPEEPERRKAWASMYGIDPDAYDPVEYCRQEARAVAEFFRRCAAKGYCLVGWW